MGVEAVDVCGLCIKQSRGSEDVWKIKILQEAY